MDDMVRVKIQTHGPQFWQITVTDADTGKVLPVLWDETHGIELRQRAGILVARVDIEVAVIDAELIAEMAETITTIEQYGGIVRVRNPR